MLQDKLWNIFHVKKKKERENRKLARGHLGDLAALPRRSLCLGSQRNEAFSTAPREALPCPQQTRHNVCLGDQNSLESPPKKGLAARRGSIHQPLRHKTPATHFSPRLSGPENPKLLLRGTGSGGGGAVQWGLL